MIIRFNYRQLLAMAFVLVAMLATSAPAMAANCSTSVTVDQYGDRIEQLNTSTCADPGDPGDPPASSLPFTGLDVGLMAGAAGVLLVGGVFLRRRSRTEQSV